MKRSGFIKRKPKKRRVMPKREVARSMVSKKPWKSREHLDRVKAQPCLFWGRTAGPRKLAFTCSGPMDPHHCRKLVPGRLLPRHDALTIPLCRAHHRMMDGNERELWPMVGIDPRDFIRSFSEEGRAALEQLEPT